MKIRITSDVEQLVRIGIPRDEAKLLAGNVVDGTLDEDGDMRIGSTTGDCLNYLLDGDLGWALGIRNYELV